MKEQVGLLCVTPSVSRDIGGIFEVERCLSLELTALGVHVDVVGMKDSHTEADLPKWLPLKPVTFSPVGPRTLGFHPGFYARLLRSRSNVGHVHSLWSYTTFALARWARKNQRPYVITPNGMLDAWALQNFKWKKDLALAAGVRRILEGAACIHVNTIHEYKSVRGLGLTNPVCHIGNGVTVPGKTSHQAPWKTVAALDGKKVLLYLSRIHPKKAVHLLLEAWSDLMKQGLPGSERWHLALVGLKFDKDAYEEQLLSYIGENNLGNTVSAFAGQYGEDMHACYAACDAFILPSFSEGTPMAVLHAWAAGKPVVMTAECNIPEGFSADAAIRIEPTRQSILKGLEQLIVMSGDALSAKGSNGLSLVKSRFSWPAVAREILGVYDWVLNRGAEPSSLCKP